MPFKKHKPEEIIGKLHEAEIVCEFRLKPARDSDAKPATIPG